jgi:hypothetical protein
VTDLYLVRVTRPDDAYGEHWLFEVSVSEGALRFTLTTETVKAMRLPKPLAFAIAEVASSESVHLRPVKLAAVELARIIGQ